MRPAARSAHPQTRDVAIDLGSTMATTPNTLELSDAELDRVTAATLQIGLPRGADPAALSDTLEVGYAPVTVAGNLAISAQQLSINALTSAQGDILFQTKGVAMDKQQGAIDAGIGNVTFDIASGVIISLGTDTTGQFSLTEAELDRITAGDVFVGSSNASLANINSPINLVSDMGLAVQARTIMLNRRVGDTAHWVRGHITLTANNNITLASWGKHQHHRWGPDASRQPGGDALLGQLHGHLRQRSSGPCHRRRQLDARGAGPGGDWASGNQHGVESSWPVAACKEEAAGR